MKIRLNVALYGAAWLLLAGLLLYLASLDVPPRIQLIWTVSAIVIMILLRDVVNRVSLTRFEPLHLARVMIVLLAGMIALRYMWWRTFHSLPLDADIYSMVGGIILYLAELQATAIFFLGSFIYIYPKKREADPLPEDRSTLPTVDVLVPTFNESTDLLRITLLACTNIRYPADKMNIYLLDDGGTVEHRSSHNPAKAKAAQQRHEDFKALCKELGVHYITRQRNKNAKAGNINHALKHIDGELILILDADHVPTVDFLEKTVAPFMKDEKLWLVQTPHFLINDDPVEKNIGTTDDMPSECELFYTSGLRGMDNWNAAFFCGSAGILRRKYLDEIGGISTHTVTEDIETSVEMHRRGLNSIYLHKPLLAGLQPETFTGFLTQRLRWTRGMLQVFMMKNPLIIKGLTFWQRICYLNMTAYWFFSIMRLIFIISPVAYLVFGVKLYDAEVSEIMIYTVPHLVAFTIYFNVFFGRTRWFLVSDVYETLQSLFAIRTVIRVVLHPQRGKFKVTPKDENIEKDFITPVANAFFVLLSLMAAAICVGLYKIFTEAGDTTSMDITVTFWAVLSFLILLASAGALFERRQVRHTTRFKASLDATMLTDHGKSAVMVKDLSSKGLCLHMQGHSDAAVNDHVKIKVFCAPLNRDIEINAVVRVRYPDQSEPGTTVIGLDFTPQTLEEEQQFIALTYGDSKRWQEALKNRNVHFGLQEGASYFFTVCLPTGITHITHLIYTSIKKRLGFTNKTRSTIKENVS